MDPVWKATVEPWSSTALRGLPLGRKGLKLGMLEKISMLEILGQRVSRKVES